MEDNGQGITDPHDPPTPHDRKESGEAWLLKRAEAELEEVGLPLDEWVVSIGILVFGVLSVSFFVAHQTGSTGFLTERFGPLEMLMLYGPPAYWLFTTGVLLLGFKDLSRDIDSYGGLVFATLGLAWLLVVFPFDFAFIADVLPDSLKFLVQWISSDIARALMVLGIVVHAVLAVFSFLLRLSVRRVRARREL